MQKIAQWLEQLGMAEYTQRFAENRIDLSVLPDLTDQDLEKLGVLLGDRRKMLRAIAKLEEAPSPPAPAFPVRPPPASATSEGAAERRYLTVLFCDLVGSTGIAAKLDAEEWRDLVGAYLDAASAAVREMGGHVAKKLGDGLLALFGYPVAQENDAERAARAALSIQRALADLNRKNAGSGKPELAARIGLDAGQKRKPHLRERGFRPGRHQCLGAAEKRPRPKSNTTHGLGRKKAYVLASKPPLCDVRRTVLE